MKRLHGKELQIAPPVCPLDSRGTCKFMQQTPGWCPCFPTPLHTCGGLSVLVGRGLSVQEYKSILLTNHHPACTFSENNC